LGVETGFKNTMLMKSYFKISGNVANTVLYFHWTFLPIFVWILFVNLTASNTPQGIIWSFILICLFFVSLLIHESAHFIVALLFRLQPKAVVFTPFGGVYEIIHRKKDRWKLFLISLSGPLANLLVGVLLLFYISPFYPFWYEPGNIGFANSNNFIFQFQIINFSLGLFNLLPVYPMDGGYIAGVFFFGKTNRLKYRNAETRISLFVGVTFILFGLWKTQPLLFLLGLFIVLTFRLDDKLASAFSINGPGKNNDCIVHDLHH
jgi:Zn-dependent protease